MKLTQLLHHLDRGTDECSMKIIASEAIEPTAAFAILPAIFLVIRFRRPASLELLILRFDECRMWVLISKLGQRCLGWDRFILHDIPPWRFRHKNQTATKHQSPQELKSNWNAVGSSVLVIFGAIVHAGGEEKSQSDRQRVGTNESSSDSLRGDLANTMNKYANERLITVCGEPRCCASPLLTT